jgi:hypothetical protein
MTNKIGHRDLKVHCKSYEGDVHGFNIYQVVTRWDTDSNNDFEESFLLEHYQEAYPDLIVTIEDYRPLEYDETPDPTVLDLVYAPSTD